MSTKPAIVGGKKENLDKKILVGLMGQVPVNKAQIIEKDGIIYTKDRKRIGIKLASGYVYINHTTSESREDRMQRLVLEKKVQKLEEKISKLLQQ